MSTSTSSGGLTGGEATSPPDAPACADRAGTWGGIERHRRAKQPRCVTCRKFASDYSREWYREALAIPTFRDRHREMTRAGSRRRRQDPSYRAAENAKNRQRLRARQERDRIDRVHAIDPVVVRRLIDGEPAQPNRAERLEAVRQLREKGISYPQIAARIGVAQRQIHRDLGELGLIDHSEDVA